MSEREQDESPTSHVQLRDLAVDVRANEGLNLRRVHVGHEAQRELACDARGDDRLLTGVCSTATARAAAIVTETNTEGESDMDTETETETDTTVAAAGEIGR